MKVDGKERKKKEKVEEEQEKHKKIEWKFMCFLFYSVLLLFFHVFWSEVEVNTSKLDDD